MTDADKLATLVADSGYHSVNDLLQAFIADSIVPAICMREGCSYICEMEPDQTRGWCPECEANSMKSALVLAGVT
jgi:hypothetical protein